jgi:quercetin dioxygenase-like cupin family protein
MSELADTNLSIVNGVFIKSMVFTRGQVVLTHKHNYDHQTLLAVGKLRVSIAEKSVIYTAPTIIVIEAGKAHFLEGLAEQTVAYCIHAVTGSDDLDDADPLVMNRSNESLVNLV